MKSTSIAWVFIALAAVGCAHTPAPTCQPGAARQSGYFAAIEGKSADESGANVCPDKEDYLENYRVGYQEGLRKHCDVATTEKAALSDGETGAPAKFLAEKYLACENRDKLK